MAEESTNKLKQRQERIDKYEILSHIATGGMGAIYKARDVDLDRLVALKILNPELAKEEKTLMRFRREAKAAARLRHENIVAIFDVGHDKKNDTYFLALEYIDGTDLQDYIERKRQLDVEEARQIMIQATRALVHAHEQGIIHRDIKPSNFLMTTKEARLLVKLTDFGLAHRNEANAEHRITRDGTTVGTVDYISPEQAWDSASVDTRSDIYSLGCTSFHMLAGTAPFARGSLAERIVLHIQKPAPDVRKLNKNVPEGLSAIINRMLAKKPVDRYQTPTELLEALENLANGGPHGQQQPRIDSAAAKLRPETKSNPGASLLSLADMQVLLKDSEDLKQDRPKRSKKEAGPLAENVQEAFDLRDEPEQVKTARAKKETAQPEAQKLPEKIEPVEEPRQTKTNRAKKTAARPNAEKDPKSIDEVEEPKRDKPAPTKKLMLQSEPVEDDAIKPALGRRWPVVYTNDASGEVSNTSIEVDNTNLPPQEEDGNGKKSIWIYVLVGSLAAFGLIVVLGMLMGDRSVRPPEPPKKDVVVKPKSDTEPVVVVPETKIEPPMPETMEEIDTSPAKMNAGPLPWPAMETATSIVDREVHSKEFRGPFTKFPEPPPEARTLRVQRVGAKGPAAYATLAEALAQTEPNAWTVVEIHDNGPLFISSLPALAQRFIILRGAVGYRPLLALEMAKAPNKEQPGAALLSLTEGKLILENLDVAARCVEDQPAVLFDLQDSDFYAGTCTFSLVAKSQQGITLVRHRDSKGGAKSQTIPQTWLRRCFVRGADVTMLSAQKSSAMVLLEESLVLGQNQPLFHLEGRDADLFELRAVRSTLVAGQSLLRLQSIAGKKGNPQVHAYVLDSILSRNDSDSPLGNMIHMAAGAEPARMKWRAVNSVYAGWKQLLASSANVILGDDLAGWHRQWSYSRGDRAVVEPWPSNRLSRVEEVPASMFLLPATSPVAYAALSGSGAIGSVVGWLPDTPTSWLERTFDPPRIPAIATADFDPPPAIPSNSDGLYHGEKLDLNKVEDLGAYLNTVLQKKKPASQVILHLTGKGTRFTSTMAIKGIDNLVLYFEQPNNVKDALKLAVSPTSVGTRLPVIEMIGGNLELIGARIELSNASVTPTIIHVQGGDLTLTRCRLLGPLTKSAGGFKSLISVSNNSGKPATVWLRNNVLLSGKSLIHLQNHVQLRARNNVFLSLGDGLHYEGTGPIGSLTHVLDHNTWAVRQSTFTMSTGPAFLTAAPILTYANSNAFINPFAEDAGKAILLRGAESALTRGQWTWQGRFNVYDARLHAYFGTHDAYGDGKQPLNEWKRIWGAIAEQDSLQLEATKDSKTISVDVATPGVLLPQLDRLALPVQVRGDPGQAPPGADLAAVGILKKKG